MLKLILFLVIATGFSCGYAAENELSFVLLAYIPDSYQCSIADREIMRGIYVDELTIRSSPPDSCTKKRLYYIPTGDSAYTKVIQRQMIFAWGNYNETFSLTSLNFLSMYHPGQIHQIHSNDIRGIAAKSDSLLFFTNREPPNLLSYDFCKKSAVAADVSDYAANAENIGVEITESGSVFLRGTGLKNMQLSFRIPRKFIKNHAVNCNAVWTLFSNRKDHIVLFLTGNDRKNIIVGNLHQNQWYFSSIGSQYADVERYDNYLVFQALSDIEKGHCAYIYDIDTNKLQQLILPPFSKIVYFSSQCIIIAQPYRLLIAKFDEDILSLTNCVEYKEAWYVQMVLHKDKR